MVIVVHVFFSSSTWTRFFSKLYIDDIFSYNETLNFIRDWKENRGKNIRLEYDVFDSFNFGKAEGNLDETAILFRLLIFEKRRDPVCRERLPVFRNETAFRNACSGDRPSRDPTWTVCFRCYYSIALRYSVCTDFYQTIAQCTVHRSIVSLSNMKVAETRRNARNTVPRVRISCSESLNRDFVLRFVMRSSLWNISKWHMSQFRFTLISILTMHNKGDIRSLKCKAI